MPRKIVQMPKSKTDREAEKQRVKTLYYSGHTLTDAAKMVGVSSDAARQWAVRDGWTQEIKQVQQLARISSQTVTPDRNIAFDRAIVTKETRNIHARTSLKMANWMAQQAEDPQGIEVLFEHASAYKAHVESAKLVAGDWEDASANKYAVALTLNQVIASGLIQDAPEGVIIEEE